jgi:hypothetical protein
MCTRWEKGTGVLDDVAKMPSLSFRIDNSSIDSSLAAGSIADRVLVACLLFEALDVGAKGEDFTVAGTGGFLVGSSEGFLGRAPNAPSRVFE